MVFSEFPNTLVVILSSHYNYYILYRVETQGYFVSIKMFRNKLTM